LLKKRKRGPFWVAFCRVCRDEIDIRPLRPFTRKAVFGGVRRSIRHDANDLRRCSVAKHPVGEISARIVMGG
jgi:hypothetical protein